MSGLNEVLHVDRTAVSGGGKCCHKSHVLDVAASQRNLAGQCMKINVGGQRSLLGENALPNERAIFFVGEREFHNRLKSASEGVVEILAQVRGQNADALI